MCGTRSTLTLACICSRRGGETIPNIASGQQIETKCHIIIIGALGTKRNVTMFGFWTKARHCQYKNWISYYEDRQVQTVHHNYAFSGS